MYSHEVSHTLKRIAPENSRFADYATSTAFRLSLTKGMVDALLNIDYDPVNGSRGWHNGAHESGLERRGLVRLEMTKTDDDKHPRYKGRYVMTEAGKVMCVLLRLAGFEAPNKVFREFLETQPVEEVPDVNVGTKPQQ